MSRGGFRMSSRSRGHPGDRRGAFHREGPPDQVTEIGSFMHAVEDEMFCSSLLPDKVPHFNAPIYLQSKSMIGKVDEILGPINQVYFSVKMSEGMIASSFKQGDKVYISGDKLLPVERFLPKPKTALGGTKRGRHVVPTSGRGRRGQSGGRGNFSAGTMRGRGRGMIRGFLGDRSRGFTRGRAGRGSRGSVRG
ncbi:hypothetical protein AX17_003746 [Amanita inopinata Kibby_2008]|nr:hypothetical protein AX17_003746 [Amanita inopinata Kibby_2008]